MAAIAPARLAAYEALLAVTSRRADLPDTLARARTRLDDERDRALAAEIAAGTLRWMGALDAIITAFTGKPLARLDVEVLTILRLSAYQLLHLDRVPAPAVVHDAVELARRERKRSAAGLVNALLRRIDRERGRLPLPPRPDLPDAAPSAALDYLSVAGSHPRWLVERWMARAGFAAVEAWTKFDNTAAPLTLRANTLLIQRDELADRLAAHDVSTERTRYAPDGLVVRGGNPLRTPLAESGLFFVQDEASQLVAVAAGVQPGERVLDACAAPGGKTLVMAGALRQQGLLVAADARPRRVALLRDTLRRGGAPWVHTIRLDATGPLPFGAVFDCVLLDAPCSGLGTIRRDPEIRWRRTPADLERLAAVQDAMLDAAAAVVRPGGRLVYATCSSEPEENEERVAAFLARRSDFALRPPGGAGGRLLEPVVNSDGFLRTWPYAHDLEAFFAALLVRHS
jgi:16S rRNA (cytosine967-C5)-methyltransferase